MLYEYNFKLSNTYGGVGPDRIFYMKGFDVIGEQSEYSAYLKLNMQGGRIHFLEGNKIFGYIRRNIRKHCGDTVTLIVPGLRDIYKTHIELFPDDYYNINNINDDFSFYNVYNYASFRYMNKNVNEYQLVGTITQYDVLHIPVVIFLALMNNKEPLIFKLNEYITIYITYTNSDFFDIEYQKELNYIDIPGPNKYNL